jgi:hypothetical protein
VQLSYAPARTAEGFFQVAAVLCEALIQIGLTVFVAASVGRMLDVGTLALLAAPL